MRRHIEYISSWSTVPRSPTRPSTAKLKEKCCACTLAPAPSVFYFVKKYSTLDIVWSLIGTFTFMTQFWNGDSLNIVYIECLIDVGLCLLILCILSPWRRLAVLVSLAKRGYSTPFFFTLDLTGFSFCCGSHPVIACVADGTFSAIS